jgi:hypothetical protein
VRQSHKDYGRAALVRIGRFIIKESDGKSFLVVLHALGLIKKKLKEYYASAKIMDR